MGGRATLDAVHRIFYDKLFRNPWMGQYFDGIEQAMIEEHRSDFMTGPMGGWHIGCGRPPKQAYSHIEVSVELFDRRHRFLREALEEFGAADTERREWLRIDQAFRSAVLRLKEGCIPRTDAISTTVVGFFRSLSRLCWIRPTLPSYADWGRLVSACGIREGGSR